MRPRRPQPRLAVQPPPAAQTLDDHNSDINVRRQHTQGLSRNTHPAAHACRADAQNHTPRTPFRACEHPFTCTPAKRTPTHALTRAHPPTCTHADAHPPADELVVGQPTRSAVPSLAPHPRLARTVLARYCVAPPALILTRIEVFCFRSTIDGLPSGAIAVSPYSKYQVYVHVYGHTNGTIHSPW